VSSESRKIREQHEHLAAINTLCRQLYAAMCVTDKDGRTAEDRIRDAMAGQPGAASWDGDLVSGAGHGDPTCMAAIHPDTARADLKRRRHLIESARSNLEQALTIDGLYLPRPASDRDRREVDASNDAGCVECARTHVADGVARWEPVHVTATGKLSTCRWCYEWERSTGRKPTLGELEQHHSGRKVKRPA